MLMQRPRQHRQDEPRSNPADQQGFQSGPGNRRDFERFQEACRKGRLRARSEADFAADHLP